MEEELEASSNGSTPLAAIETIETAETAKAETGRGKAVLVPEVLDNSSQWQLQHTKGLAEVIEDYANIRIKGPEKMHMYAAGLRSTWMFLYENWHRTFDAKTWQVETELALKAFLDSMLEEEEVLKHTSASLKRDIIKQAEITCSPPANSLAVVPAHRRGLPCNVDTGAPLYGIPWADYSQEIVMMDFIETDNEGKETYYQAGEAIVLDRDLSLFYPHTIKDGDLQFEKPMKMPRYNPKAKTPDTDNWIRILAGGDDYLDDTLPAITDEELAMRIELLEVIMGGLFVGNPHQKTALLIGAGRTGKDTFINYARRFLGELVGQHSLRLISGDKFSIAELISKKVIDLGEIKSQLSENEITTWKRIISGDYMRAEIKYVQGSRDLRLLGWTFARTNSRALSLTGEYEDPSALEGRLLAIPTANRPIPAKDRLPPDQFLDMLLPEAPDFIARCIYRFRQVCKTNKYPISPDTRDLITNITANPKWEFINSYQEAEYRFIGEFYKDRETEGWLTATELQDDLARLLDLPEGDKPDHQEWGKARKALISTIGCKSVRRTIRDENGDSKQYTIYTGIARKRRGTGTETEAE